MRRSYTTLATGIAYSVFSLSVILGCADFKAKLKPTGDKINASIRSAVDPLEDVFTGDSKKKTTPASTSTKTQTQSAQPTDAPPAEDESFFDTPKDWTIVKFVAESQRYQLKHDGEENASMVISYHKFDAQDEDARQEQLRQLHTQLISRLPENYKKLEYREWVDEDHPHLLTRLKGKKGEDGPEMLVEGYAVGIGAEGFIVFAAFPKAQAKLSEEISQVVKSLRPMPQPKKAQPDASPAQPAQEPAFDPDSEEEIQGKPPTGG